MQYAEMCRSTASDLFEERNPLRIHLHKMAQSVKMSQRLLATLIRTHGYYKTQPTLLMPGQFRNHSDITPNSSPVPTGFSVTFADGSLAQIFSKPPKSVRNPVEPATKAMKRKETRRAKQKSINEKQMRQLVSAIESHSDSRGVTLKRRQREDSGAVGCRLLATQEAEEPEIECLAGEEPQDEHVQKYYPDTRIIDDVGCNKQVSKTEDAENTKSIKVLPARTQKPPSAHKETWQVQKTALKNKFGTEGWKPRKKLSPDTMEGIRALHTQYPEQYPTGVLAEQFAVSPEAIRRILKSKWSSNLDPEKIAERRERWAKRHDQIWDVKSQIGLRPKRKGAKAVEDPDQFEEELRGKQLLESYRNA